MRGNEECRNSNCCAPSIDATELLRHSSADLDFHVVGLVFPVGDPASNGS
jgi:hypothetical protein